jgi:hypothetical protein
MIDQLGRMGRGLTILTRVEFLQTLEKFDLVIIDEFDELVM